MRPLIRHGNGAGGDEFCLPHPHPLVSYTLPVTLLIPNEDEKLNFIPVPNRFAYFIVITQTDEPEEMDGLSEEDDPPIPHFSPKRKTTRPKWLNDYHEPKLAVKKD